MKNVFAEGEKGELVLTQEAYMLKYLERTPPGAYVGASPLDHGIFVAGGRDSL